MKKIISDRLRELLQDPKAAAALRRELRAGGVDHKAFKITYQAEGESSKEVMLKLVGGL